MKLQGLKMFTLLGRPYFYGLEKSLKKFDKFLTFWGSRTLGGLNEPSKVLRRNLDTPPVKVSNVQLQGVSIVE